VRSVVLGLFCAIVVACPSRGLLADVLTFDSLTVPANNLGTGVPNGYGGLNWSDFLYKNGTRNGAGFANGVVSPSNIVYTPDNTPGELLAIQGTFTLASAYFTAAWRDGLQITVNAYNGRLLVDSQQFTVDTTGPTFETFNFANITEATFTPSGGTLHPGYNPDDTGEQIVMDNVSIVTPEPSSVILAFVGAICLLLAACRLKA
jgi:hypothetical protein